MFDRFNTLEFSDLSGEIAANLGSVPCHIICGHQKWPGLTTEHAIRSLKNSDKIRNYLQPKSLTVFYDDIGANTDEIQSRFSDAERELVASILQDARGVKNPVSVNELFKKVHDALIIKEEVSKCDTALLMESIIYNEDRNNFIPFGLQELAELPVDNFLFEKKVSNAASRQIHKIMKKEHPNLKIDVEGRVRRIYLPKHPFFGDRILLREETLCEDMKTLRSASNFCSIILAQLFKYIAQKENGSHSMSILYYIPCYDRTRLINGMMSFFMLYGNNIVKRELPELKISTIFETGSQKHPFVMDCVSWSGDSFPKLSTFFLSAGAGR